MNVMNDVNNKVIDINLQEKKAPAKNGMAIMLLDLVVMLLMIVLMIVAGESERWAIFAISIIILCLPCTIVLCGLRVLKPNEALVLTIFGKYYGTLKGPGFYWVNPFATATNPAMTAASTAAITAESSGSGSEKVTIKTVPTRKISLKTMTMSNDKQKINDQLGNPIIIGIVVIWRVVNTAKAVFNVENYTEFLSIQCDSALRNIVRLYPYDVTGDEEANEKSLRGSSQEIAGKLCQEIQDKVDIAGLEVMEARITHLAYAPEIAAVMLQRQQASAIIDARQMIVDGAVGMVEMALNKLGENHVVELDEERKAAMVSNLLVVLCGNRDAQPIVNSGSIY